MVENQEEEELPLHQVTTSQNPNRGIKVMVEYAGTPLEMEVDTGAAVSIISEHQFKQNLAHLKLTKPSVRLTTYTGEKIASIGEVIAEVKYQDQAATLPLRVVKGTGPNLIGRDWLQKIRMDWNRIIAVVQEKPNELVEESLMKVMEQHKDVFKEGTGVITPFQAKLNLKPGANPKFHKPRRVPMAIKEAVGKELDRLEREGILKKVTYSEWAAPVVPVRKSNGSIRLCGDYKTTINSVLEVDQYPLPRPEDLFAALTGGQQFTKLDLRQAYLQMELEPESQGLVTINTHQGLYQYTRVPFGIAPAPALFQKMMDTILQGLDGVICYIDDILITAKSEQEHLHTLHQVLQRLEKHGVRLQRAKCSFLQNSVEYLGHKVDKQGLHTTDSKVEAIVKAPSPRNTTELKSFLGSLHYYGKFIKNLAMLLQPLNELLKHKTPWHWTAECETAFQEAKTQLSTAPVLTHYDPNLPLRLAGDASSYGIGAVVSQIHPDGTEHPVAFASRTLSDSERNYAQIEREALSLIYGVKKFHPYLFGRRFIIYTDHRPLTTILGEKKGIPSLAAARLQRWALLLSAYDYEIQFKPTSKHSNADMLSRLPQPQTLFEMETEQVSINAIQVEALPVTPAKLRVETRNDKILSKVLRLTKRGWPKECPKQVLKPYWNRRHELTIEEECLLWGTRVIIPTKLQSRIMEEVHQGHPGVVRMKALTRSLCWWPRMDQQIDETVKACQGCQSIQKKPLPAPLHPWIWPSEPWERIHVDFAGPFQNKVYLIVVDAYSKWPEVIPMASTTTEATIKELRKLFAAYGIPRLLISDNGPQFMSEEFQTFVKNNAINHKRSAPYHPATNGQVERFVQTFKQAIKAGEMSGVQMDRRLENFLLSYRTTPHSTTKTSPCELFLRRVVRTRLEIMKPDLRKSVQGRQELQKLQHDDTAQDRKFQPGQDVMVRNYGQGDKWIPGVVESVTGPLSYTVRVRQGIYWKRHIDQLRGWTPASSTPPTETPLIQDMVLPTVSDETSLSQPPDRTPAVVATGDTAPQVRRYPSRNRKPPDRFS